jgi:hypothetical protein
MSPNQLNAYRILALCSTLQSKCTRSVLARRNLIGVYFLYVDESGKSGLHDPVQPFHVLGGLIVSESIWQDMEADLNARIDAIVPPPRPFDWELHMTDMVNGKGYFGPMRRQDRTALAHAVLDVIDTHKPTLIFTVVEKAAHVARYGSRARQPEEYTYELMIERFNHFLGRREDVGMIVSDDQKGSEDAIRQAHSKFRRKGTWYARIEHVIETPFFAPSHWSRMLQIVDVATWYINRGLRNDKKGQPPPPETQRLEPHLDGYPNYMGRGFKVVP